MDSAIVLPLVTLVLGAAGAFLTDTLRHNRIRREQRQDLMRSERAAAYSEFVTTAHYAAHRLGRSAPLCPQPLTPEEVRDDFWLIDSQVTRAFRVVQLVGSPAVALSAAKVRQTLYQFRKTIEQGHEYGTESYRKGFAPVQAARDEFIAQARSDIAL